MSSAKIVAQKPAGNVSPLSSPGQALGADGTAAYAAPCAYRAIANAPQLKSAFRQNRDTRIDLSEHIELYIHVIQIRQEIIATIDDECLSAGG
jgi:hypothetical protein